MNRRDFIRSLFAALVAALVPWKSSKANPMDSITVDWRDSLKAPAMGGPVRDGVTWFENEGYEFFTPNTEWQILDQPPTFQHSATVKSAAVLDLGETIVLESTDGKYAITRDGGITWEEISAKPYYHSTGQRVTWDFSPLSISDNDKIFAEVLEEFQKMAFFGITPNG